MRIERTAHFTGHKDCIYALAKGLKPNTFFTGAAEGYVVEWNHVSKGDGTLLAQVPAPVYALAAVEETLQLMAGSARGNLHVIDLTRNKEVRNIEAHTNGLYHIHPLRLHPLLITSGGDGKVCAWDRSTLEIKNVLHLSEKSARVMAFSPDEQVMAVGYSDHHIRLFSLPQMELLHDWMAHESSVFALTFSTDGKSLLSGGRDVRLKSWNLTTQNPQLIQSINAHNLHINYMQLNPDGQLLATVSMDKTLKIWDAVTLQLLKVADFARYGGHTSSVNKVIWVDNRQLITCSDDRSTMLWKIETDVDLLQNIQD
jgi:WD40 repeat protein